MPSFVYRIIPPVQDEEFLRANFALPHEVGVDVAEEATPELQTRIRQHSGLERQVVQVNALQVGRALDLTREASAPNAGGRVTIAEAIACGSSRPVAGLPGPPMPIDQRLFIVW